MAQFESRDGKLFIDGKEVLKGWESYTGWYWFAVRKVQVQESDMGDGTTIKNDQIWFGFVQGLCEEWGDFSEGELKRLMQRNPPKVWEIPYDNLPWSGRR